MKNLFKEAHKMTREIATKYEVNYQSQFGLVLSYLLENKEEEEKMLENLKGTEKQVKLANDIAKDINAILEDVKEGLEVYAKTEKGAKRNVENFNNLISFFKTYENAGDLINDFKEIVYKDTRHSKMNVFTEVLKEKNMKGLARVYKGVKDIYFEEDYK